MVGNTTYPIKKNGEVVGYRRKSKQVKKATRPTRNVVIKRGVVESLSKKKTPPPKKKQAKVTSDNVNIGRDVPDMTRYVNYDNYGPDGYYTTFRSKSRPQNPAHETIVWHQPHSQFKEGDVSCSCPGWRFRRTCKHVKSVEADVDRARI